MPAPLTDDFLKQLAESGAPPGIYLADARWMAREILELRERLVAEIAAFGQMEKARDCLKRQKAKMQALALELAGVDCPGDHE
jgi:hypothetical protein